MGAMGAPFLFGSGDEIIRVLDTVGGKKAIESNEGRVARVQRSTELSLYCTARRALCFGWGQVVALA